GFPLHSGAREPRQNATRKNKTGRKTMNTSEGIAANSNTAPSSVGIWPAVMAGLLTAFVGYASSFTVVLQGLKSVGATPGQATSGLIAVGTAMGLCAIVLAWRRKMPISIAWSTPGAALLA